MTAACKYCGREVRDGARYCDMCGKAMAAIAPKVSMPDTNAVPTIAAPAVVPAAASPAAPSQPESNFSRRRLPVLAATIAVLAAAGGWWYFQYRPVMVSTECYHVGLPASFRHDQEGEAGPIGCNLSARRGDDNVVVSLASPQISEAGLPQAAKQAFGANLPAADIKDEQAVQFAGQPAYRISGSSGANSVVYYYVYDRQATVRINTRDYHAYRIVVTSRGGGAPAIAEDLERGWQWRNRGSK